MNPFHEKILFGSAALTSAGTSTMGAMMTEGETRWVFVTFTICILTASFLALMFKKSEESIRLVIGRCGFSVIGGILATQPAAHYLKVESVHTNVISLAALSSLVCIGFFFIGFAMLKIVEAKAPVIAEKWFKKIT